MNDEQSVSLIHGCILATLIQANETQLTGGASNNAVMLVTDGAPESYEQVFKEYNWDNVSLSDGSYKIKKWVSKIMFYSNLSSCLWA